MGRRGVDKGLRNKEEVPARPANSARKEKEKTVTPQETRKPIQLWHTPVTTGCN